MIRLCRTSALGSHAQVCQECGSTDVSFNSCRNRHCPKCQHSVQEEWVEAQMSKLLPVGYFHTVFTIPQELNILVLQNQRLLYSLLIKSAGHTLMELAKDPKFLGATIGITSVLHTWGQNLSFHPHYPDAFFIPILSIYFRKLRKFFEKIGIIFISNHTAYALSHRHFARKALTFLLLLNN